MKAISEIRLILGTLTEDFVEIFAHILSNWRIDWCTEQRENLSSKRITRHSSAFDFLFFSFANSYRTRRPTASYVIHAFCSLSLSMSVCSICDNFVWTTTTTLNLRAQAHERGFFLSMIQPLLSFFAKERRRKEKKMIFEKVLEWSRITAKLRSSNRTTIWSVEYCSISTGKQEKKNTEERLVTRTTNPIALGHYNKWNTRTRMNKPKSIVVIGCRMSLSHLTTRIDQEQSKPKYISVNYSADRPHWFKCHWCSCQYRLLIQMKT